MKKFFTLSFVLTLCTSLSFAQVIFEQDFENGMAPMTLIDGDGLEPNLTEFGEAAAWIIALGNGGQIAASTAMYATMPQNSTADDWMISPALEITEENTVVFWQAQTVHPDYPCGYEVRVSTTGTEIDDFTDVLYSTGAENTEYTARNASLEDYAGQTIHIAWRNNSTFGMYLAVDNIKVEMLGILNASAIEITNHRYNRIEEEVAIKAIIKNNGFNTIHSLDVSWTDGVNTYTDNVTGLNLVTDASIEYTHTTPFIPVEARSYDIAVTLSNPNGGADAYDIDNNTSTIISGVTYSPQKRVVIEESTGTWCGFCPRGYVAMEYMREHYPESFIGIAVHNNDPMAYDEYNSYLNLPGSPRCNVDRIAKNMRVYIIPDDFINYHEQFNQIPPVAPDIMAGFNAATRELEVEVSAEYVTRFSDIDHRFSVVLIEDEVSGTTSGYDQSNYMDGSGTPLEGAGHDWTTAGDLVPASEMVYQEVARAIVGGYYGTPGIIFGDVETGDVFNQTFTYTVPEEYDAAHMHAIVLVLDGETGAILNSNITEFDIMVSTHQAFANDLLGVFPNPSSGLVNIELAMEAATEVQLTVYTITGKQVASQDLGTLPAGQPPSHLMVASSLLACILST